MKFEETIPIIVSKYLHGECTYEELQEAFSIFGNPGLNERIKEILDDFWNSDETDIPVEPDNRKLNVILQQIHEIIKPDLIEIRRKKARRAVLHGARFAAILIIGMVLGISINAFRMTEPITITSKAPKGSVSQMILPDSTLVYLNSDSELQYTQSRSKRTREVYLNGEAFFQVKENKKEPFVVHTSVYDIHVTGTEFNVKAYQEDKEFTATVVSGSVIIPSTDRFKIKSDKILAPGQQLLYNLENRSVFTSNVEPRYFTAWTDNKLIFINMSLEELVVLLERKFGVDIEVTNNSILKYHYDGTITNESILEVLEIIKVTLPIQYKIENQRILITKKQGQ